MKLQFFGGRGASSGKSEKGVKNVTQSDITINASDIDKLHELAKKGIMPYKIEGTRDDKTKMFEEIDRLYAEPPGAMSDYKIRDLGSSIDVNMMNNYLRGVDPPIVSLPRGSKASESEKRGAIKHAIYNHRDALELAAMDRRGGFGSLEMQNKWGGRRLTNAEKLQVDKEQREHIKKLFKSPISKKGEQKLQDEWLKDEKGLWYRG